MGQGGLIQLVAYGNQDLFLTSSPSITFFKSSVRRYTAFAIESVELLPSSSSSFGRRSVFVLSRNGDLAGAAFVQWKLPKIEITSGDGTIAWTSYLGHVLAQEITMSIGGSQIDKHTTEWLQILFELQTPASKIDGYNYLIGQRSELTTPATSIAEATIYTPLQFWYNRSVGLSLPLIALQFHESKIEILVRQIQECYIVESTASPPTTPVVKVTGDLNVSIWQDYIFLDVSERSSIAAEAQEQIIQLLSWTGVESTTQDTYKSRLAYNHPSLYMAFALRLNENTDNGANRWCDFTMSGLNGNPYQGDSPLKEAVLLLNGTERFQKREAAYFAYIQPLQRFTRVPGRAWIFVYSFSLFPETSQPSGSLNASRIDQLSWVLTLNNPTNKAFQIFFFSQHVNVLRIKSGMAGLAFSSILSAEVVEKLRVMLAGFDFSAVAALVKEAAYAEEKLRTNADGSRMSAEDFVALHGDMSDEVRAFRLAFAKQVDAEFEGVYAKEGLEAAISHAASVHASHNMERCFGELCAAF